MDAPESHSDHDAILLTRDRLITGPFRRWEVTVTPRRRSIIEFRVFNLDQFILKDGDQSFNWRGFLEVRWF